jgi:hypothetical protein
MVATSSPPMMANAIGRQNTVGAIGIRPSTVKIADDDIGRRRRGPLVAGLHHARGRTASCAWSTAIGAG